MTSLRPPTAADVARLAGTSTAVVSYVVNDGPRPVSAATRARVQAAVQRLGYRPNRAARSLRYGTTSTIGVIVPSIRNLFFATLAQAIETAAFERGLLTYIACAEWDERRTLELSRSFVDASVDGIIAASSLRIESDRARLVYVHDSPRGEECVASDPTSAGRLAADLLTDSGYDRIALVTSPNPTGAVAARTRSAKARLRSQGIEFDVITAPYDQQAARDAVAAYLFRHRRSVGLLCITDDHAVGAIAGVHEAGRSVPDDVGLVSVDGTQTTDSTWPRITSVAVPIVEMGQLAVAVCTGESPVLKERLPVRTILRGSTLAG